MPLLFLLLAVRVTVATAPLCPCGLTVDLLSAPNTTALFTDIFETDFLHLPSVRPTHAFDPGWRPQNYDQPPQFPRLYYGLAKRVANVVARPLARAWDWGGPAPALAGDADADGADPGLQMWVRARTHPGPESDRGYVSTAELVSARRDMLYGSFRVGMKPPTTPGTCAAFFFYRDDTQEIDIEVLSHQQATSPPPINLVIQSPKLGAPPAAALHVPISGPPPTSSFLEYRFDWLPDRVDFSLNGRLLHSVPAPVPHLPGALYLAHWSNANPRWSGGPPRHDAPLAISYVKAYFNSSAPERQRRARDRCAQRADDLDPDPDLCRVPAQTEPPDPVGARGNVTGRTFFFTAAREGAYVADQIVYDDERGEGARSGAAGRKGVEEWAGVVVVVAAAGMGLLGVW